MNCLWIVHVPLWFAIFRLSILHIAHILTEKILNIRIPSRTRTSESQAKESDEISSRVWRQTQCQSQPACLSATKRSNSLKLELVASDSMIPAETQSYIDEERTSTTPIPLASSARSRETGRARHSCKQTFQFRSSKNGFFPLFTGLGNEPCLRETDQQLAGNRASGRGASKTCLLSIFYMNYFWNYFSIFYNNYEFLQILFYFILINIYFYFIYS